MRCTWLLFPAGLLCLMSPAQHPETRPDAIRAPEGWRPGAPRDEIRPRFAYDPRGGPLGTPAWLISSSTAGMNGYWHKDFPVAGGGWYRFSALVKTHNIPAPRRDALVEIVWQDQSGRTVPTEMDSVEPELPPPGAQREDGWTELSDTYRVPVGATRAQVDLVLRWAAGAVVKWSEVSLQPADPPPPRVVRVAAAHLRPENTSGVRDNLRLMEPLVKEAAARHADLLVFGELYTTMGARRPTPPAEPVPGPTTARLAEMARRYQLYLVVGLPERDGHLLFNTAILLAPDGRLVGKHRKLALTEEESRAGYTPGDDYSVFQTRFGKLGIMICYDLFFPEVARRLAGNGAEIIAVPIWGGDEILARARAMDNRVFLVTSTYEPPWRHWMRSGVWDREGNLIAAARRYGTIAFAEIDLNERFDHKWLGDFRNYIPRARPLSGTAVSGTGHGPVPPGQNSNFRAN